MILPRHITWDKAVPFVVFAVTGLVFLPVFTWLLGQTSTHEQLLHAFLVFILTGGLIIYERRIKVRPVWRFNDTVQNLLIASYALMVVSILTRLDLVVLASLSFSIAAFLYFVLGAERRRIIFSSVGAFAIFTAFAVFLPVMDWPLRRFAGHLSASGLNLIGQEAQLGLYQGDDAPMLLLFNNGTPFHVAAECNGFGILVSSLLMATIIVLYRRLKFYDRLAFLGMALLTGLLFNALRIVVIVLLAPLIPESSYMIMHEGVGLVTTYGGLAFLYFLLMPRQSGPGKDGNVTA